MDLKNIINQPNVTIIDVRETYEFATGHVEGALNIPLGYIPSRLEDFRKMEHPIILYCRSGNRSGQVHAYLEELGYDNVHNMAGGILAWEAAGLEVER